MSLVDLGFRLERAAQGELNADRAYQWRAESARLLTQAYLRCCEAINVRSLLEVGAHGAETSIDFVARSGGSAIAFEANPHTFRLKTKLAERHGVIVRNIGLAAQSGTMDLHLPMLGGVGDPLTPGSASLVKRVANFEYETVSVTVSTVDQQVKELDLPPPLALWVDVEGFGREVLDGARDLLMSGQLHLIHIEVESERYWDTEPSMESIDALLEEVGFEPVMRDAEYVGQCNVVYCRAPIPDSVAREVDAYWDQLTAIRTSKAILWLDRIRDEVQLRTRIRKILTKPK